MFGLVQRKLIVRQSKNDILKISIFSTFLSISSNDSMSKLEQLLFTWLEQGIFFSRLIGEFVADLRWPSDGTATNTGMSIIQVILKLDNKTFKSGKPFFQQKNVFLLCFCYQKSPQKWFVFRFFIFFYLLSSFSCFFFSLLVHTNLCGPNTLWVEQHFIKHRNNHHKNSLNIFATYKSILQCGTQFLSGSRVIVEMFGKK